MFTFESDNEAEVEENKELKEFLFEGVSLSNAGSKQRTVSSWLESDSDSEEGVVKIQKAKERSKKKDEPLKNQPQRTNGVLEISEEEPETKSSNRVVAYNSDEEADVGSSGATCGVTPRAAVKDNQVFKLTGQKLLQDEFASKLAVGDANEETDSDLYDHDEDDFYDLLASGQKAQLTQMVESFYEDMGVKSRMPDKDETKKARLKSKDSNGPAAHVQGDKLVAPTLVAPVIQDSKLMQNEFACELNTDEEEKVEEEEEEDDEEEDIFDMLSTGHKSKLAEMEQKHYEEMGISTKAIDKSQEKASASADVAPSLPTSSTDLPSSAEPEDDAAASEEASSESSSESGTDSSESESGEESSTESENDVVASKEDEKKRLESEQRRLVSLAEKAKQLNAQKSLMKKALSSIVSEY